MVQNRDSYNGIGTYACLNQSPVNANDLERLKFIKRTVTCLTILVRYASKQASV